MFRACALGLLLLCAAPAAAIELDAPAALARLHDAEAALRKAEAAAEDARTRHERVKRLRRKGLATDFEVEDAGMKRKIAQAALEKARAAADLAREGAAVLVETPDEDRETALVPPDLTPKEKVFGASDLAVVVGIEDYAGLPPSAYSRRDAERVRGFLLALGLPKKNVAFLEGPKADRAGIRRAVEGWLLERADTSSRILLYYSGRGLADPASGEDLLLSSDGKGYPLRRLYERLKRLGAAQTLIVLDTCFSGESGRCRPTRGAAPDEPSPARRTAVLTASEDGRSAAASGIQRHGLLTYHFLKALQLGDKDLSSAYERLRPAVEMEARRMGARQSPGLRPGPEVLRGTFRFRR